MLRLNLDETALCMFQGKRKGNVFITKKAPRPPRRVSQSKLRMYLSHVAFICDDPSIQPKLPHVIIGNVHTIPRAEYLDLRLGCAGNIFLERLTSAWNNSFMMMRVVTYLHRALKPYMSQVQPILLMDTASCHFNSDVLALCRRFHIWVVAVPAKLTWLLQPLDTNGFAAYKARLRKAFQTSRIRSVHGQMDLAGFLRCVEQTIRSVLQGRRWAGAFDSNGFGNLQADVSRRVLAQLGWEAPLAAPSTKPSEEQLQIVFPKNLRALPDLWPNLAAPAVVRALPLPTRFPRRARASAS